MRSIYRNYLYRRYLSAALVALGLIFSVALFWVSIAAASSDQPDSPAAGEYIVTVYDSGTKQRVLTKGSTVKQILKSSNIDIAKDDKVEPSLDTEINSSDFTVNVYRAHPVLIIDGMQRISVMTSHSTPSNIAKDAGIELRDEDIVSFKKPTDILEAAGGLSMQIKRALPIKLNLYGKKVTAYTQAKTVAEFLKAKDINLGKKDDLSVALTDPIKKNMKIEIWRNGIQTVTRDETIKFPTRQIEDMNQPVGYKKVRTPGVNGKKTVTYEVLIKNGKEVKRKAIQTVVLKQPSEQVEVVGAKPSFSGDFAAALAKLRSCEGGYSSWNPAGPYYGAYQFDRGTWGTVADPAKYGNATPAEQDKAAHNLYQRRGWQPWPVCGASLPDIYR